MQMNHCRGLETDLQTTSKPSSRSPEGHGGNLPIGHAVSGYRWRDSNLGFDRELENLCGGDKGKGTSGSPAG